MKYDSLTIIKKYNSVARLESQLEHRNSFRLLIPRFFILKYLRKEDLVLDAGGGTGMNAILMAAHCKHVTLVDLSPEILKIARANIDESLIPKLNMKLIEGDITDLAMLEDSKFTFVVCVGAALSYTLDLREQALKELVRVAKKGAIIILQVQSKTGMIADRVRKGLIHEALEVHENGPFSDGLGVRAHLFTLEEIITLLQEKGCEIVETATSPVFTHAVSKEIYKKNIKYFEILKELEVTYCTFSELLGLGHHLIIIARKF